ncbi:MAG: CopG family transcriptional regulator [Microthrixaceae bacterium]
MRTTVDLDDDTAAAVDELRAQGLGLSEAVNELMRRGLVTSREEEGTFVQSTRPLGLRIDVSNVAAALDTLEGITRR